MRTVFFGKMVEKKTPFKSPVLWKPLSFDELVGNVVISSAKLENLKFMEKRLLKSDTWLLCHTFRCF